MSSSAASLFELWSAEQDWFDAHWADRCNDSSDAAYRAATFLPADDRDDVSAIDSQLIGVGEPVDIADTAMPRHAADCAELTDPVEPVCAMEAAGATVALASANVLAVVPAQLDDNDRVEWLTVLERAKATLDAAQANVLAVLDAADPLNRLGTVDEVAQVLRLPGRSAQNRLKTARTLVAELPATLAALATGRLSAAHAEAICQASWAVPPEEVGTVESAALDSAPEQTVTELRRTLRRAVLVADVDGGARRHCAARAERRVEKYALDDGMGHLAVTLPATDVAVVFARLDAAARLLPRTDERSLDERRADLLVDAVLTGIPVDGLPVAQGRNPNIQVTVAATTLLGLDEAPGYLHGHGAIPAELARSIARDETGVWRRMLTDGATGGLLEYGRTSYRPPQDLRDFVVARDGECCFPGCRQPAYRCEVEHCQAYDDGGTTDPGNLSAVCKHHHQLKTKGHWSYRHDPGGGVSWTSATGRTYRSRLPEPWVAPGLPAGLQHLDQAIAPSGALVGDQPDPPPF